MRERTYTTVVYPLPYGNGGYRAECVQYPQLASDGATAAAAIKSLKAEIVNAVQSGLSEVAGDVITTAITVRGNDGAQHTYLALLLPDEQHGYASYCPAVGTASMGDTPDEARAMLAEATALHLEEMAPPRDTADVRIERISVALPDSVSIQHAATA
ncbi:MAG TPA: hypothetical protein VKT52_08025 [Ktedonobacterales bacterium]|nr:hypothetical protein [Ktedonobacterales bacterium]